MIDAIAILLILAIPIGAILLMRWVLANPEKTQEYIDRLTELVRRK